jgi:hypothetical protein
MAKSSTHLFFSGFLTTVLFVALVAGVLGGLFLVIATLTNTGGS